MNGTETHACQWAHYYAGLGWPVLPVAAATKKPLIEQWPTNATTDATIISDWYRRWPSAGIGILTGIASGLLVLDVDPRNGGTGSLAQLEADLGPLPQVPTCITGGGGQHRYFQHPGGRVKCSANAMASGIDIKADDGYVVAPPSIHESRGVYGWQSQSEPLPPVQPLPASWLARLAEVTNSSRASHKQPNSTGMIPLGERNNTLTSIAGTMRRRGLGVDAIEAALIAHAQQHCEQTDDDPIDEVEIRQIAESVCKYEPNEAPGEKQPKQSVADRIVEMATDWDLFHATLWGETVACATVDVNGSPATFRVDCSAFRELLSERFYHINGKAPSDAAIKETVTALSGYAKYERPQRRVAIRLAGDAEHVAIDLGDDSRDVVLIDRSGPRVVAATEVETRFLRPAGLEPLPRPDFSGSAAELAEHLNLPDDDAQMLVIGWAVAALFPSGPYAMLVLNGEQGSAKSTATRYLRTLIDPNSAPLRSPPRDERDLMIAAGNSHLVSFDNLSGIRVELSDALCRLATGGSMATRRLYTDQDEVLIFAIRPVIVNGIDELIQRSDLADRAVVIHLPRIAEGLHKPASELDRAFETARPRIFGGLLNAVWASMCCQDELQLDSHTRMADFEHRVEAGSGALGWYLGQFGQALRHNRAEQSRAAIENSPIGPAILRLMERSTSWSGSASELRQQLLVLADASERDGRSWPRTPRVLGSQLRRLAPNLRQEGINVDFGHEGSGNDRKRVIYLKVVA